MIASIYNLNKTAIQLEITEYRLRLGRELRASESPQLRGFFGRNFSDEVMFHHHQQDGTLLYKYPRIQFKVIDRMALLLGLAEGSDLLARLWLEIDHTTIGSDHLPVLESTIIQRRVELGETTEAIKYRFVIPWLALNQENERHYAMTNLEKERQELLEKTLIGNCLSISKSFGYTVNQHLKADASKLKEVKCMLKGVTMRGFVGTFAINFLLPDKIGLGKSVSRGFGTIERIAPQYNNYGESK